MRILVILMDISEENRAKIRSIAKGWDVLTAGEDGFLDALPVAEVVAGWHEKVDELCLRRNSALRWIQNWGAGVNHLPMDVLRERGILLTNTSGIHAVPISEVLFAYMLCLTRRIHLSLRSQQRREWTNVYRIPELHGQTLGILGAGAIGLETARLAKAFGMRVLGVRRSGEPAPNVDRMYGMDGFMDLLQESDFVANILPLTRETRHVISTRHFSAMKPTACYLSVGRGGTTHTGDLVEALRNGIIAGAGLDVFETEPLPADSPLWDFENVIITPHNAGDSVRNEERVMDIFLPNLREYAAGRAPSLNRVSLELEY